MDLIDLYFTRYSVLTFDAVTVVCLVTTFYQFSMECASEKIL